MAGENPESNGLGLTFRDSKNLPVHRWYPYVEGFSAPYIKGLVRSYGGKGVVFDPFGGSGTVNLIASLGGVPSAFCEANPFMRFVAEAKVNARHVARLEFAKFESCVSELKKWAFSREFERLVRGQDLSAYSSAFEGRDFFNKKDIRELQALRDAFRAFAKLPAHRDLLLLAVASVTVACSHMTRRADLRRRRSDEYIGRKVDVRSAVLGKLDQILRDVRTSPANDAPLSFVAADARDLSSALSNKVTLVLTSPPYLNGTSYIRNTKLELWLLGFIESERELVALNKTCMVCGINNVLKGRPAEHRFPAVDPNLGSVHLLGHSRGGAVVLNVAGGQNGDGDDPDRF
jgi:hypothetical protein